MLCIKKIPFFPVEVKSATSFCCRFNANSTLGCGYTCNCRSDEYFPICGSDNKNYLSPCYAGCIGKTVKVAYTIFLYLVHLNAQETVAGRKNNEYLEYLHNKIYRIV